MIIRIFCLIIFLIDVLVAGAQNHSIYRYDSDFLNAAFYKGRRAELKNQLPDSSMAILFSSALISRSRETNFSFHQQPSFYYLTGFTEPNSVLLIFKTPIAIAGIKTDEILFISTVDRKKEQWTGVMPNADEAKKISGIQSVFYTPTFDTMHISTSDFKKVLYLSLPSGLADDRNEKYDLFDLIRIFKEKVSFPPSNGDSYLLGKYLSKMREVKQPEEISLMKKAIAISAAGHIEIMRALHPGMFEYETQAVGEYVFKKNGAEDVGYQSICGGGANSIVLHYESNRKQLSAGELLLLDMGAEYHGYSADITRTLPVNGTFSPEQRIIYDLVLKARDSAFSFCAPGNEFHDPHKSVVRVISKGLLDLGIIQDEDQYDLYFIHGTSHYLGLDVHDVGTFGKLQEGNVITIEPGIYIPSNSPCDPKWWNIGIRIEDDVLITSNGYENLSANCPSKPEEIEKMMKEEPVLIAPVKK